MQARRSMQPGVSSVAAVLVWSALLTAFPNSPAFGQVFRHGVASGDPAADAVVIWARVSPPSAGPVDVEWMMAADPAMSDVLKRGRLTTTADTDYTVKVDVRELESATTYYYRFAALGAVSPVGRAKTLPVGSVEMARIAVVSCANYPSGYFTAYRMLARQPEVDIVLHLGDYIYEYAEGQYGNMAGRELEPPHEILTLADYRARYAHYRSDPDLQAVHRQHTFVTVWDDHEFADNAWRGGAFNHDDADEGPWRARRTAAMQAYYDWLPVRPPVSAAPDSVYRSFAFGQLAQLIVLDARLSGRDEQLLYGDFERDDSEAPFDVDAFLARYDSMERSILGRDQFAWLESEISDSIDRGQTWRILGQQVIFADLAMPDVSDIESMPNPKVNRFLAGYTERTGQLFPLNLDSWGGYPGSRRRLADFLLALDERPVFVTGDTHNSWAIELHESHDGERIGVEFGAPAVSSPSIAVEFPDTYEVLEERVEARNPAVKYAEFKSRGYLLVTVTEDSVTGEWRYVDVDRRGDNETCGYAARVLASSEGAIEPVPCGR